MPKMQGAVGPAGDLGLRVIRNLSATRTSVPDGELTIQQIAQYGCRQAGLPGEVNRWRARNWGHLKRGFRRVVAARLLRLPHFYGKLSLVVLRANGEVFDLGLASLRVVTTVGVGFLVDAFQNLVELETMKYHGIGTGAIAEAVGDIALGTELTTQYNPDNTRATGTTAEGASANIYKTVGTNTVDAAVAITEHGILSQAATGGGVLFDRSVFAVINLASGDSLQTTYEATFSAGG